jgi:hypothetical protein
MEAPRNIRRVEVSTKYPSDYVFAGSGILGGGGGAGRFEEPSTAFMAMFWT